MDGTVACAIPFEEARAFPLKMLIADFRRDLRSHRCADKAAILRRFFKTGPGEYGEGDRFLGIPVPIIRQTVRAHPELGESDARRLLASPWHEERFAGLVVLVRCFSRGASAVQSRIVRGYLHSTKNGVNNWDLVDASAPYIIGTWLSERPRKLLFKLAGSRNLWKRRIAIVSTLRFVRSGDLDDAFRLCETLLEDECDLIQKACGWVLRETGKRNQRRLTAFLSAHRSEMPRTMLRAAIERYPEEERKRFLKNA